MTTEEKAKAYDEALKKAKDMLSYKEVRREDMEYLFPELTESKDERMKNAAIMACKYMIDNFENSTKDYEDAINWLEKQGEHANFRNKIQIGDKVTRNENGVLVNLSQLKRVAKPADKVEPKFKVGDWVIGRVTNNEPRQISEVTEQCYKTTYGGQYGFSFEDEMHLWTIEDAKDGDVLVMQKTNGTYESIFIFNKIENNRIIQYLHYFTTDADEEICEARSIDGFLGFVGTPVHPATKEQRDLLFQKMKEESYEWDAEKKKLKKIEQKLCMIQWKGDNLKEVIGFTGKDKNFEKWFKSFEEYEKYVCDHSFIFKLFNEDGSHYEVPVGAWIVKTPDGYNVASKAVLKQKSAEWSEEDEKFFKTALWHISYSISNGKSTDIHCDTTDWFKSLKDRVQRQSQWKPSEEQLGLLERVFNGETNPKDVPSSLKIILEQLKKLKG